MQANSRCTDDPLMAQRAIFRQPNPLDHREDQPYHQLLPGHGGTVRRAIA